MGVGDEFVTAVHGILERIAAAPASFPQWPGATGAPTIIRKATLTTFPYLIAFEQHTHRVMVLGVVHQKRRPLYWLRRATRGTP